MKKIIFVLISLLIFGVCYAAGDKFIAFPNPVNINNQILKISPPSGKTYTNCDVEIYIYDINGRIVYEKKYSTASFSISTPFKWKGYKNTGERISQGLYFVKIILTESDGEMQKNILRVLVKK